MTNFGWRQDVRNGELIERRPLARHPGAGERKKKIGVGVGGAAEEFKTSELEDVWLPSVSAGKRI